MIRFMIYRFIYQGQSTHSSAKSGKRKIGIDLEKKAKKRKTENLEEGKSNEVLIE